MILTKQKKIGGLKHREVAENEGLKGLNFKGR